MLILPRFLFFLLFVRASFSLFSIGMSIMISASPRHLPRKRLKFGWSSKFFSKAISSSALSIDARISGVISL